MGEHKSEPPLLAPPDRPAAAGRVAAGLVIFGLVTLVEEVAAIFLALRSSLANDSSIHLTLPMGFLGLWFAAWLVWNDKRVVWPIMTYLTAVGLGSVVGLLLAGLAVVPAKLIRAFALNESASFSFYAVYVGGSALFLAWISMEARSVAWPHGWSRPRNSWLQPRAVIAYSAVVSGLLVVSLWSLLNGPWTKPALDRARLNLGPDYHYQVVNYDFRSVNGHATHHARVLAYTDTQLDSIQLNWEDDSPAK